MPLCKKCGAVFSKPDDDGYICMGCGSYTLKDIVPVELNTKSVIRTLPTILTRSIKDDIDRCERFYHTHKDFISEQLFIGRHFTEIHRELARIESGCPSRSWLMRRYRRDRKTKGPQL